MTQAGVDQADMAERLREVTDHLTAGLVDLLVQQVPALIAAARSKMAVAWSSSYARGIALWLPSVTNARAPRLFLRVQPQMRLGRARLAMAMRGGAGHEADARRGIP
jgi:hypothetical protein